MLLMYYVHCIVNNYSTLYIILKFVFQIKMERGSKNTKNQYEITWRGMEYWVYKMEWLLEACNIIKEEDGSEFNSVHTL